MEYRFAPLRQASVQFLHRWKSELKEEKFDCCLVVYCLLSYGSQWLVDGYNEREHKKHQLLHVPRTRHRYAQEQKYEVFCHCCSTKLLKNINVKFAPDNRTFELTFQGAWIKFNIDDTDSAIPVAEFWQFYFDALHRCLEQMDKDQVAPVPESLKKWRICQ